MAKYCERCGRWRKELKKRKHICDKCKKKAYENSSMLRKGNYKRYNKIFGLLAK